MADLRMARERERERARAREMRGRDQNGNYYPKEACLTMHQPWASLLVHGIKRIEGRSWPAPIRGRLWIHAASKVPDEATINAMEEFYRQIYALDGITDLKFPEHYPVSRLLGCVEVVGCLRREELACWTAVPEGVRLEALTSFCWLCERPQKLLDPLKMRGDQGVYNLDMKIAEAAVRCLLPVESPSSIKFPLPNPHDSYSLRPGSLHLNTSEVKEPEVEKSPSLTTAIAGAVAAATQFSKKGQETTKAAVPDRKIIHYEMTKKIEGISQQNDKRVTNADSKAVDKAEGKSKFVYVRKHRQPGSNSLPGLNQQPAGPSLIFSAAMKNIRPV